MAKYTVPRAIHIGDVKRTSAQTRRGPSFAALCGSSMKFQTAMATGSSAAPTAA